MAILAKGHVFFQRHVDIVHLGEMILYRFLRAQVAVAVVAVGHVVMEVW